MGWRDRPGKYLYINIIKPVNDYLKLSTVPIAVVGAGGSSRGGSLCFCFKKSEMPLKTNIVAILWEPSATKMPRLR